MTLIGSNTALTLTQQIGDRTTIMLRGGYNYTDQDRHYSQPFGAIPVSTLKVTVYERLRRGFASVYTPEANILHKFGTEGTVCQERFWSGSIITDKTIPNTFRG